MALDKPTDTDETYQIDGFEYIVEKDFMEKAKPIKIGVSGMGFKLDSSLKLEEGCSGCGSDSDCG